MNSVQIIGNVATEVELRHTKGGDPVARFRLAVNRPGKDSDADFFTIIAWNRQAEICEQYLSRGSKIGVNGRLQVDKWQDKEGNKRENIEIIASNVTFLSQPQQHEDEPSPEEFIPVAEADDGDDDIPF